MQPLGGLFVRLLKMIMMPIIVSTLIRSEGVHTPPFRALLGYEPLSLTTTREQHTSPFRARLLTVGASSVSPATLGKGAYG
jgi:hypothetical protein